MHEFGDQVLKGDKVARKTTVDVDARTIEVWATTKRDRDSSTALYHRWTFDLGECPDEKIWEVASRGFVIDMQRGYRDEDSPEDEEWADATFVYPDDFATERRAAKPSKKTSVRYLKTLTPEERISLIEEMNAEEAAAETDDVEDTANDGGAG